MTVPGLFALWLCALAPFVGMLPVDLCAGISSSPGSGRRAGWQRSSLFAVPAALAGLFFASRVGGPGFWPVAAAVVAWLVPPALLRRGATAPDGRGRPGSAAIGLLSYGVGGSLALWFWTRQFAPGLPASAMAPTLLLGLSVSALAVVVLTGRQTAGPALALGFLGWVFLAFTQFLVVWSANLPEEATWLLDRGGVIRLAALVLAASAFLLVVGAAFRRAGPSWEAKPMAASILASQVAATFWIFLPMGTGHAN